MSETNTGETRRTVGVRGIGLQSEIAEWTQLTLHLGFMLHPSLQVDRAALADICRRYHIRELSVFGSATRDDFRPDSDVDVLVEHEPGMKPDWDRHWDMRFALEAAFQRPVDLVDGRESLVNPFRRRSILASLERLYAA